MSCRRGLLELMVSGKPFGQAQMIRKGVGLWTVDDCRAA